MEFLIPTSVPTIVIACILLLAVSLFIAIDGKAVRRSRRLFRQLIASGKHSSLRPVSVIIELTRSANSITPLLDHLFKQKYSHLEVVIVIKHTAGKNARKELESYRRKQRVSGLRLVKHAKGLTMQQIIRRYTNGELLLQLTKDDRLSDNFFSDISLDYLLSSTGVIAPIRYLKPGKSLASGLSAHFSVWSHFIAQFNTPRHNIFPLENGIVYSRALLIEDELPLAKYPALRSRSASISTKAVDSMSMTRYLKSASGLVMSYPSKWTSLLLASLVFASAIILGITHPSDFSIVAIVIIAVYVAISARTQLGLTGYSAADQVTLLLLSPFGLFFALLIYALSIVRLIGCLLGQLVLRSKSIFTKPLRLRRQ